jgi:hypothetical protein
MDDPTLVTHVVSWLAGDSPRGESFPHSEMRVRLHVKSMQNCSESTSFSKTFQVMNVMKFREAAFELLYVDRRTWQS